MTPRIGILGGGQLGRMMVPPAVKLGYDLSFLDPNPDAAVAEFSRNLRVGDFSDENVVVEFARNLDVLTLEIEAVSVAGLEKVKAQGVQVFPAPHLIAMAQDKAQQKQFFIDNDLPTAPFWLADDQAMLESVFAKQTPNGAVQKLRYGGYDGRGVKMLNDPSDCLSGPSILETKVKIDREIGLVVARDQHGGIEIYDPVSMEFDPELNLVMGVKSPANLEPSQEKLIREIGQTVVEKLAWVGVLALEFFVDIEDKIWINEIAPRVHNSGHLSIESCVASQFENHLRAVAGDRVGSAKSLFPARMHNLVGNKDGTGLLNHWERDKVLAQPQYSWHWYGKTLRPGRKVGHITERL